MSNVNNPPSRYKPGDGVRFFNAIDVNGVWTDISALTFVVECQVDRSQIPGTPVNDPTVFSPPMPPGTRGHYYADIQFLMTSTPGVWVARWQSTGAAPANFRLKEYRFILEALDF